MAEEQDESAEEEEEGAAEEAVPGQLATEPMVPGDGSPPLQPQAAAPRQTTPAPFLGQSGSRKNKKHRRRHH
jgi:hypothetical protein